MWTFFIFSVVGVGLAVAYMLWVYPARGVPLQVKVVTGYAWVTTLLICCIVPIDVQSTLDERNPRTIDILWDFSYWSTQILTWLLIPMYMGYADAGEFTWKGKMWASAKTNFLFWVLMVIAGAFGLAYGIVNKTLNVSTLPGLVIQLSNTFGLIVVLTLLGFGLVHIPCQIWKRSYPERELRYQQYRLGKTEDEREQAQNALQEAIGKVIQTKRVLGRHEVEARQHIEDMLYFIRNHTGNDAETMNPPTSTVDACSDYADELPQLHAIVMQGAYSMGAIDAHTRRLIVYACYLTEVCNTRGGREVSVRRVDGTFQRRASWNFNCFVWPYVLKAVAVLSAMLGAVIVWCECTIGSDSDLSPLSHLMRSVNGDLSQLVIVAPLIYVITCTYTAFFAINIGSLYRLTPTATSAFSLLFNGTMMARFGTPLCFNYLHVIRMNTEQKGHYTVFAEKMGLEGDEVVAIPLLGTAFNEWAPLLLLAVVLCTAMNVFGRLYNVIQSIVWCLPQLYVDREDDDDSTKYVQCGQRAIAREMAKVPDADVGETLLSRSDSTSCAPGGMLNPRGLDSATKNSSSASSLSSFPGNV